MVDSRKRVEDITVNLSRFKACPVFLGFTLPAVRLILREAIEPPPKAEEIVEARLKQRLE